MDDEIFENISNEFGIELYRRIILENGFVAVAPIPDYDKDERKLAASYGD